MAYIRDLISIGTIVIEGGFALGDYELVEEE
jgi:hypothetical protein